MIEYCLSNVEEGARRRLRTRSDAMESPCLEHCGICCVESFVVVDGTLRRIDDHETALETIEGNAP